MSTTLRCRISDVLNRPSILSLLCFLCVGLAVWFAFGGSLQHGFVWDDHGLIVHNDQVKEVSQWHTSFYRNFWKLGENMIDPTRSFYRPLISLSYTLDYGAWGLNPKGFHATNVVAHFLTACMVFLVTFHLLKSRLYALLATVIFAVHPTHVENVSWISGRTDVFCGLFYFTAFYFFIRWVEGKGRRPQFILWTALCYMLSLFSKEMGLTFPFVVGLHFVVLRNKQYRIRDFSLLFALLITVTAVYLFLRITVLGQVVGPATYGSVGQRLLSVPMVFTKYIGLLLSVWPVDPHHSEELVSATLTWKTMGFILLSILYGGAVLWTYAKRLRKVAFFFMWIPITLLPVFKLGTFGDVLYADRFLYIPSFGLPAGLFALVALSPLRRKGEGRSLKALAVMLCCVFVASLFAVTRANSSYWTKDLSLFRRAAITSPQSAYVQFNLGNSLSQAGSPEQALQAYLRAVALYPEYTEAYTNLGTTLKTLGRYGEALAAFHRAMALQDETHILYSNLGDTYRALGDPGQAASAYRHSLGLYETHIARNNLGECLIALGQTDLALREFKRALELKPAAGTYNNLALLLIMGERYDEALPLLQKAFSLIDESSPLPQVCAVRYNLARVCHHTGYSKEASVHARYALNIVLSGTGPRQVDNEALDELKRLAHP